MTGSADHVTCAPIMRPSYRRSVGHARQNTYPLNTHTCRWAIMETHVSLVDIAGAAGGEEAGGADKDAGAAPGDGENGAEEPQEVHGGGGGKPQDYCTRTAGAGACV